MKTKTGLLAGLLVFACGIALAGQAYKNFPGAPLDERTLRAQDRVEELYERGDYARALMIAEQDLAPIGDKYAQYIIGFMHLTGKGVPQDKARALAWYRLAAERGEPALVQARDALLQLMSPEQIAESNRIFAELWQDMGDNRILLRLIRADIETLKARTGTRIPGAPSGPLTIIDAAGNSDVERYYSTVEKRMRARLAYLKSNVEIIDIDQGEDDELVRTLEQDLKLEVASINLP